MNNSLVERMAADAAEADGLQIRGRNLLVDAVRMGHRAGMTQRAIATAVGRSQPEVSRLLRFDGKSPLGQRLRKNRPQVLQAVTQAGGRNIRIFGSVARGQDGPESDIDLLIDLPDTMGLFAIARLEQQLSEILGVPVDVVPATDRLRANLSDRIYEEAVPL